MNALKDVQFADAADVRREIDSSLAKIETELEYLQHLLVRLEVEEVKEMSGMPLDSN